VTLTEASKIAKKGVILFGILVVVYYIFLLLLLPSAKRLVSLAFPERDPPTPVYGNLPPLEFVEKEIKNDKPSYFLDTSTGRLPKNLPGKMHVFEYRPPVPSFEKGKAAQRTADVLGYYEDDLVSSLKEEVYRWRKLDSNGLLQINTNTKEIIAATPLAGKSDEYPQGELSKERALKYAQDLLDEIGRLNDELYKNGTQNVTFLQYYGNRLEVTETPLDAQLARVDFFRSINDTPILGPDPKEGLQYVFLRRPSKDKPYLNYPVLESHLWQIRTQTNATYPIISVADAWNLIKNNKGVVVNVTPAGRSFVETYDPVSVEEIFINEIYLAYYDNTNPQEYLQPIYVFEGKYNTQGTKGGELTIYYPAVAPEYIRSVSN
jgi:hypothetical protein